MNVKEYISSGIVESYVLGLASEAERHDFETNCALYPEIADARRSFELVLEEQLLKNSVPPPAFLQQQVEEKIKNTAFEATSEEQEKKAAPVRRIGVWRWVAAASVILLLATAYWAITVNKKYQDFRAKNEELEKKVQESTTQISEMQEDLDKIQTHAMKAAALKSEDDRAYAIVYWDTVSTSKDVYLMVNNLPQPASDKQYQLWALLNGEPIDLGMIEVSQKRLLYRMKNLQNAEAFAITLEPKGGSQRPTTTPIAVSNL
jgi:anti-sigma-K factor RskA